MKISKLISGLSDGQASNHHYTGGSFESGEVDSILPQATYDCFTARNCSGRIRSHRDPHNCKTKTRGKSVRNNLTGTCTNL